MINRREFLASTELLCTASWLPEWQIRPGTVETAIGPVAGEELGPVLMHEHIMVDFAPATAFDPARADAEAVVEAVLPRLRALREQGVRTFVDASSCYLGRRADIYHTLSERSGVRIVCATGLYKAPHLPAFITEQPESAIRAFLQREIEEGLDGTGIKPGVIKLAASQGTPAPEELKVHRAAAVVQMESGLPVTIHCPDGKVALHLIQLHRDAGVQPERLIIYHSSGTADPEIHARIADTGAWPLFDGIGRNAGRDAAIAGHIESLMQRGFQDRVLIGGDVTWYEVGQPGGGRIQERGYSYLIDTFLPGLRARGFSEAQVRMLMVENPRRALTEA